MSNKTYSLAEVRARKSAEFAESLAACAHSRDGDSVVVSLDSECFLSLVRSLHVVAAAPVPEPIMERQPRATAKKVIGFAQAWMTANRVPLEVLQERIETCERCPMLRSDPVKGKWCKLCGCSLSATKGQVKNLAAYEENLPAVPGYNPLLEHWGCKLDGRKLGDDNDGKGWKR
jgi:hypothetical protein